MAKKEFKNAISAYTERNRSNLQEAVKRQESLKLIRKEQGLDRDSHVGGRISLGKLVALVLIIALLFRVLIGGTMPTFASLLDRLRSMPSIPVEWTNLAFDLGDWGIFNWLRDMFAGTVSSFGMLLGLIASLFNCIPFVWSIIMWIVVG